jgi:hypothetical protein
MSAATSGGVRRNSQQYAPAFVIPEAASCWKHAFGMRPSGTQGPQFPSADVGSLELRPDLDSIEALGVEREALWTRIDKATFLTPNEKRAAIGYGPISGGDELKSDPAGLTPSDTQPGKLGASATRQSSSAAAAAFPAAATTSTRQRPQPPAR